MSLDMPRLKAAIRRNVPAAVRAELRDATEAERKTAAKALKELFRGPAFPDDVPFMVVRPADLAGLIASGFRVPPVAGGEHAERERKYQEWQAVASGLAFRLAVLGLAGGVAAAARAAQDFAYSYEMTDADIGLAAAVLADRAPGWLADFMDRHLRMHGQYQLGIPAWPLARKLVKLGAITRPSVPEYTTLLPGGVLHRAVGRGRTHEPLPSPAQALLADPGLLEEEVWRLFTVPDAGLVLEQADRRADWMLDRNWVPEQTWSEGLAQLSAQGHLDRGRLIDACLDAFCRDFSSHRVSWYAVTLQQLSPSTAEIAERQAKYLSLLAAGSKAGISVGQQGVRCLLDAGLLDARRMLDGSAPALLFPQKSIAAAQLKLIGAVIAALPAAHPQAAGVAAVAFGHERQDIQEAALALIRKHGIPDGAPAAEMRSHAAGLAPGLAAEAAALGLSPDTCLLASGARSVADGRDHQQPGAGTRAAGDLAALEDRIRVLPDTHAPSLVAALALVTGGGVPGPAQVEPGAGSALPGPVTDPEELIALLTMLLEDAADAIAVERVLAGAVRLSGLPPRQRSQAAAPLLKRAAAIMDTYTPFSGERLTSDIALIAHVWGSGQLPAEDVPRHRRWHMPGQFAVDSTGRALTMAGIVSARAWEVARIIEAGHGGLLLAEPQTSRGAITPDCLLERLQRLAHHHDRTGARQAGRYDRDAALLRLAPTAPDSLWAVWEQADGTTAGRLRETHHLLRSPLRFEAVTGQPTGRPLRGSAWNQHLLARITGRVPVAPGCASWQLLTRLDDPLGAHADLAGPSRYQRHYGAAVAGWTLACPWQPELAAAHLLRPLRDGLRSGISPATTAIISLIDPAHPLGPVGHLALVTGLASAEADTRIAAAQLWAGAAADGRLQPSLAAAALVTGVTGQALKLNRIADSLKLASHSPLPARRIVETICAALPGLATAPPAGMHQLLELAAQLAATTGTPGLPRELNQLAGRRSRLGTTARQLQQAQYAPAPGREQAAIDALTALVTRAESQ